MANTLTNTQNQIIADAAVLEFNLALAPLRAFSLDLSPAATQPGAKVTVPVFATRTAIPFAGNYAGGDSTVIGVDVTLNQHIFNSAHVTDREVAESSIDYLNNLGKQGGRSVAKGVLDFFFGLVTAANFGNAAGDKLIQAPNSVTANTVADLRNKAVAKGMMPSDCALVLNSAAFTSLLKDTTLTSSMYGGPEVIRSGTIPSLFGFRQVIESPTLPTNAENLIGFVAAPQAIAGAMRYLRPVSTEGLADSGMVSDEQTGATLGFRVIPEQLAGKTHYVTEALFGASKVDGKTIVRLLSA
jgi:hypothetical protein